MCPLSSLTVWASHSYLVNCILHPLRYPYTNIDTNTSNTMQIIPNEIGRRIANNPNAFKSLANILLKSFVTANSDKEQTVECLRRKEKLSVTKWAYEFMHFYGYALFYTHLINFTQFYACTVLYLFYSFYSVLCLGLFETDSIPVLIMPKIGIFWEFTCSTDGLDWKIFVDFCII